MSRIRRIRSINVNLDYANQREDLDYARRSVRGLRRAQADSLRLCQSWPNRSSLGSSTRQPKALSRIGYLGASKEAQPGASTKKHRGKYDGMGRTHHIDEYLHD